MREIKLPSGAILKVAPARFEEAKALYQAVLKEAHAVKFGASTDMAEVYKDLVCVGFSSKEIESCLWVCMKKCSYNSGKGDLKIDADTFEPVEARDDYLTVCMEVAKENIHPFVKSLYAQYVPFIRTILSDRP